MTEPATAAPGKVSLQVAASCFLTAADSIEEGAHHD